MRNRGIAILALAGIAACSAQTSAERKVIICTENSQHGADAETVERASVEASRKFARIGVKLAWHDSASLCQPVQELSMVVSYSNHTPKDRLPGALAASLPYEGVHIVVFYDRISAAPPLARVTLLAHVLAHEITHILQGVARHSDSGVMKAHWDRDDLMRMTLRPLDFTAADVLLLHKGMAARTTRVLNLQELAVTEYTGGRFSAMTDHASPALRVP